MTRRILIALFVLLLPLSGALDAASRRPVRARHGMVVAADPIAARVGRDILRNGGNAVDAAVAVGFALAVTYPSAGNIGGGGFMTIRLANGRLFTIDYREKAPAKAGRDMYLDSAGNVIEGKSIHGYHACGVPGSVSGMLYALEQFGSMPRARVIKPAMTLADKGFRLSDRLASSLESAIPFFEPFPSTMKVFTRKGKPYKENDLLRQRDLARTLERIARYGRKGFYEGKTADLIVAQMRKGNGLITRKDLRDYHSIFRKPVTGSYRGIEVVSMGPPSSGGVALIQILNILEGYPLHEYGWNSSRTVHLMTEAMRRVYADRAEFLGDPGFTKVPVPWLVSKEYAQERRSTIDTAKATPSSAVRHGQEPRAERMETTHYSVADRYGNCVSVTTTLNGGYGSGVVVDGAGFLLNDEMDDFSIKPGVPNMFGLTGGDANAIEPGKRMLSSMTPTILVKDGKPFMVIGTPGGSTIITTVAQIIVDVVDFHMNIREAIDAPRFHHQWLPDRIEYEPFALQADVVERLRAMGHEVVEMHGSLGLAEGIMFDRKHGVFLGASDSRGYGEAVGY